MGHEFEIMLFSEFLEHFQPETAAAASAETLTAIFVDMEREGLLEEVFHERPFGLEDLISMAHSDSCRLYLMLDRTTGMCAGAAWLSEISETDAGLRACAGYCFFRDWWKKPITYELGKMMLERWFDVDGMELIWGMTPKPNRLSRLFTVRLGFRYVAELEGFCSYKGQWADAKICVMTRKEWENGKNSGQGISEDSKPVGGRSDSNLAGVAG